MKWSSAVSDNQDLREALTSCILQTKQEMGDATGDIAVVFISHHFAEEYDLAPPIIHEQLGPILVFGCSAGGVIGDSQEVEHRPGVSLTVGSLPGVEIRSFHLDGDGLPDQDASPSRWEEALGVRSEDNLYFMLLADPFTFPAQAFIEGMDYAYGKSIKIGGLASSGQRHGQNALFLGDQMHRSGAIGIALKGNIVVDTVVAQGCRPIGELMCITKSHQNMLVSLDERPPLEVLKELFAHANERDQALMQSSLYLGIVMDDFNDKPQQGDFLIRNVMGLDSKEGAMAIGELLQEGQRVQFHLRDALTSAEDLSALLAKYAAEERATDSSGALLFSCLGRGEYLYGRPDHDTGLFKDKVGVVPLGGFFCNGEIGPVGGSTYLHGYTSSFGIFRPIGDC